MKDEELARRRADRALEADRLLRRLFDAATPGTGRDPRSGTGMALVAVGGFGRSELSPHSDLDVVLLHDPAIENSFVDHVANAVWYPLWDRGIALDHSVRDTIQMREAAAKDYRAATGMLDARAVAGDAALVLALRSAVLADWRRDARRRLVEVREAREARIDRAGWIAHAAIPDLKESGGGLRDGALLRALVATWLVDVPHAEAEDLRRQLLDVRDILHEVSGKRGDRLTPEVIPEIAARFGMGAEELDLHVRSLGRRTAHLSALVWRRVDEVLAPAAPVRRRAGAGPRLDQISPGVAILDREVVLTVGAEPAVDPELGLRLAYEASSRGLAVAVPSAVRLADEMTVPLEPWPRSANRLMVSLLASGSGLVRVWDELDYAGAIEKWLPEWSSIRLRGSSSPVHRFTVDRHSIETCVQVRVHLRAVSRPDLLVVAALLHDIGKGVEGDHSAVGAPIAEAIARRWGFSSQDAARIGHLVHWHLLLPTVATRRDIEDPSTAANVAEVVGNLETLELLAALTEADARATGASAWSPWRAGLITGLVAKVRDVLRDGVQTPDPEDYEGLSVSGTVPDDAIVQRAVVGGAELEIRVATHHAGSLIVITIPDRTGSMADMAGGIALAGLEVLSARAVTRGSTATTLWEVSREDVDIRKLTERIKSVIDGTLDLGRRLRLEASGDVDTTVTVLENLSETATLIEVRAQDRRGLVWAVCQAIAAAGVGIRSAHLSTYGPEARDVFYVVGAEGEPLDAASAERLRLAVRTALVAGA